MNPRLSILACDPRLLGAAIFVVAEEVGPTFCRAFTTNSHPNLEEILPRIKLELSALYLHLFDRDVFIEAGASAARDRFADSLFKAVSEEVEGKLGVDPSDFTDFCNERQIELSNYTKLFAGRRESVANTLFWEFGKKLGLTYEAYNPVAVQAFSLAAADGYIALLETVKKLSCVTSKEVGRLGAVSRTTKRFVRARDVFKRLVFATLILWAIVDGVISARQAPSFFVGVVLFLDSFFWSGLFILLVAIIWNWVAHRVGGSRTSGACWPRLSPSK